MIRPIRHFSRKSRLRHGPQSPDARKTNAEPLDDGIVAVRTLTKDGSQTVLFPPTPLDGTNHPLPKFGATNEQELETNLKIPKDETGPCETKDFRFSSAVDIPSQEEIERRERERLVVSGTILGPDGKPAEYAVVYLTDLEGNKIGQSCRSNAGNGFFKVLVHETGSYLLHVYKRGFAMSGNKPVPIPIESGKIDGLVINLVSQGLMIQGRVLTEDGNIPLPEIQINCVCRSKGFASASKIDDSGHFRLFNVPINSECYLEAVDRDQNVLARTEGFETIQKKQIYKDIVISALQPVPGIDSSEVFNPFIEPKKDDGMNDDVLAVSGP
ncbi:MAG: carboxypeptidase-like regulatory domain-containing protein [Desulfomonilaceae bacterium]